MIPEPSVCAGSLCRVVRFDSSSHSHAVFVVVGMLCFVFPSSSSYSIGSDLRLLLRCSSFLDSFVFPGEYRVRSCLARSNGRFCVCLWVCISYVSYFFTIRGPRFVPGDGLSRSDTVAVVVVVDAFSNDFL